MQRRLSIAALFVSMSAVGLLAGCGGGTVPPHSIPVNENLVTNGDIRATPPGSPQRSPLQWWRAVQYEDLTGYLKLLSPSLRRQRTRDGRAQSDIVFARGTFIPAKPKILNSDINGDSAAVYTRIYVRQPVGASRTYSTSFPQAFTFVRKNKSWRLANDLYIEQKANEAAQAVNQAKKGK
jgi:hypothetical protein